MSYTDEDIRPRKGDSAVPIPFTLEVPRVSGEKRYRSRIYFATGFAFIGVIACFIFLFGAANVNVFLRIALFPVLLYLLVLSIRLILEERAYRKDIQSHYLNDYRMSEGDLWGIYNINKDYPYLCYFRNGRVGVFILFDKNVRVGRDTAEHHHEHYERVADAYRVAGQYGASIVHVDYMGNLGVDERISELYNNIADTPNTDVRDVLTMFYSSLENLSSATTSAHDVFILTHKNPQDLFDAVNAFESLMVRANFITYRVLDQESIRTLTKNLYNLEEFSAVKASQKAVSSTMTSEITPLRVLLSDGSTMDLTQKENL